jgi:hypothetical protein
MEPSTTSASPAAIGAQEDAGYTAFLARLTQRLAFTTENGARPLFTTSASELFPAYLAALPEGERQTHNCRSCRAFLERFGALAVIDDEGRVRSALWSEDDATELYIEPVRQLRRIVERAKITGVFLTRDQVWGSPKTGAWQHLSALPPASMRYTRPILEPSQAMAEKREEHRLVAEALQGYPLPLLESAVALLQGDALYRSEKVLGPVRWLRDLSAGSNGGRNTGLVWAAVARAPAGFCHPKASMTGTLLEDLAAGLPFNEVSTRFAAKMRPDQYQRPQAPPKAGAIDRAERIAEELGIGPSLPRRYANLEDLAETLWRPRPIEAPPAAGGVFGMLREQPPGAALPRETPAQEMTWSKFARTILPEVREMEIMLPSGSITLGALTTAVNAEAPPLLQWDRPEQRNPVAWYQWTHGSPAEQWGLRARIPARVLAISALPHRWFGAALAHHGEGVLLVIEGARDTRNPSGALFPENLRAELHEVRSVIEAYSKRSTLSAIIPGQLAAGLLLMTSSRSWPKAILACRTSATAPITRYTLDRWD